MVRTRYIGSTRAREAGFSATHKQDFTAHVTGGDWIHPAYNISELYSGNVQQALDDLYNMVIGLGNVVVGPPTSVANGIAIFQGTTGDVLVESLYVTTLDPTWGDLILPDGTDWNTIKGQVVDIPTKGQDLWIVPQNNLGGPGGDLKLFGGHNGVSGLYDGSIQLFSSRLAFDVGQPSPLITQNDATGTPNDLFIISQGTNSSFAPSSLWLESGVNSLGQAGSIYLYSYPGVVSVQASSISFDPNYPAVLNQGDLDTPTATSMYISPQSIPFGAVNEFGTPGNLWLNSGYNYNSLASGNIYLFADTGLVNVLTSNMVFGFNYVNPTISQEGINTFETVGQPITLKGQNSSDGTGGNVVLDSGWGYFADPYYMDGNIILRANDGNIMLETRNLLFAESIPGVQISQPTIDGVANGMTIAAQSSNHDFGADLTIYSGQGFILDPPALPGDDGDINIFAGTGYINIGGTARNGSGSVNLMGLIFFPNTLGPTSPPVDGVFMWANNGNLYCMTPSGDSFLLSNPLLPIP